MEKNDNNTSNAASNGSGHNSPSDSGSVSIQGIAMPKPLGTLHTFSLHEGNKQTPESGCVEKTPEKRGK